jgi:putative tricarboxylic transport membrane protein
MLPIGLFLGRYAYRSIIAIPKALLAAAVAFLTIIGTYAVHNSLDDVMVMLTLGVIGWVLDRFGFSPSPIVLGLILGPIAEQGFVQAHLIGTAQGNVLGMLFGRPISLAIIAFALLTLLYPLWATWRERRQEATREEIRHAD